MEGGEEGEERSEGFRRRRRTRTRGRNSDGGGDAEEGEESMQRVLDIVQHVLKVGLTLCLYTVLVGFEFGYMKGHLITQQIQASNRDTWIFLLFK